jgi:flagellar FliL protein
MAEKKTDSPAPEAAVAAAAGKPSGGGLKALMPALLAIVLAPAATFGVAHFVILPRFDAGLKAALAADPSAPAAEAHAAPAAAEKPAAGGHGGGHGAKGAPAAAASGNGYKFESVVVNLAGTMGTRYLKTSFLVTGERGDVAARFEAARPQLGDVTLGVLSSLSLADLEDAGSKNLIRERLLAAYNQALGGRVVDNLFFAEFVVQ